MKKRLWTGLAVMAAFGMVLGLSGCGGGQSASSASEAGGSEQAAEAGDSGEQVTISFWHKYCQPGQVEVFEEICKEYEEANPNVKIEISTTTDDDMKTKLQVALGSSELPDVYQTWSGEYCEKFARGGYALDLTPYLEEDPEWKDSFYPACYSAFTY